MKRLVLASGSSIRRKLLAAAGFHFEVVRPDVEESVPSDLPAREISLNLALAKAWDVARRHPDAVVVGADQVLILPGGSPAGKPPDRAAAREQLRAMAGRWHTFVCGCAVIHREHEEALVETVDVRFRTLSATGLEQVLDWNEWPHSAGAYQLENRGIHLVEEIRGNTFTVLGLPLLPLVGVLTRLGVGPLGRSEPLQGARDRQ